MTLEFPPDPEFDAGIVSVKPSLQSRPVIETAMCDIAEVDKMLFIDAENLKVYVEEQRAYLGRQEVPVRATYQWRIRGLDGEWHYFWDTWSFEYTEPEKICE